MKKYAILTSIFGMTAVMLGAFGAHGLKNVVDEHGIEIWNKGVLYQFVHTFAIFIAFLMYDKYAHSGLKTAALFYSIGIFLFSGSLYLLACRDVLSLSEGLLKIIGPITPLGGLSFIIAWICMFISLLKTDKN